MNTVQKQSEPQPATQPIQVPQRRLVGIMADKYQLDPSKLLPVLKETCFKGSTDEQMVALLVVANEYNLNPFVKEIYAFPAKGGGIVPVVGIDGWLRIINEHPAYDGMEAKVSEDGEECVCTIYRKDRSHPTVIVEYLSEVKRNTDPWNTCPRRMLRHKAIIQCARVAFAFTGIKDEDEAEIISAEVLSSHPIQLDTAKKAEQTARQKYETVKAQVEAAGKKAEMDKEINGFMQVIAKGEKEFDDGDLEAITAAIAKLLEAKK